MQRTFPTLHREQSPLSHGSTSFGLIYCFVQPVNKKYEQYEICFLM